MTSKLVVNTIEADTGISSVSFGSSISLSSTSKFFFSAAGVDIGADTNINRPASGVLGFNINSDEKVRIDSSGRLGIGTDQFYDGTSKLEVRGRINTVGSASTGSINSGNGTVVNVGSLTSHDLQMMTGNSTRMTFDGNGTGEALRIDSSNKILIGTNSINGPYDGIQPHILLEGTSYDTTTLTLFCNANTDGASPQLQLGKSRGTSDGSTTIVQNNDRLGSIWIVGADGTDRNSSFAALDFRVDGTPGANNTPGRIEFRTTSSGSSNPSERMRLTSGGLLGLNVTPSYSGIFGGSQRGMHIGGTTAPFLRITSSTGSQGDLLLQAGNSGGDVQIGNMNAAGDIVFYTKPSGGSNTERFRITSEGDLKAASFDNTYACMYRALSNSQSSNMMNSAGVMLFSSATFSMGNSNVYNTSNGRYTAPIRGLYLFNVNVLMDNSANGYTMGIRAYVDGAATDIWYIYERGTENHYKHTSGSHVVALNAGQYHQFYATAGGAHISNETCFSACLIQAY